MKVSNELLTIDNWSSKINEYMEGEKVDPIININEKDERDFDVIFISGGVSKFGTIDILINTVGITGNAEAGMVAFKDRAAYVASKGAVIQSTKSIALDYASQGVCFNALWPDMIETPMVEWRLDQPDLQQLILS